MHISTFYLEYDSKQFKVTIHDETINSKLFYFARNIDVGIEQYKILTNAEKESCFGALLNDVNGKTLYYKSKDKLERDIKEAFGKGELTSEV